MRKKKDGISVPIKKRVTSLPTLSLEKYLALKECVCNILCVALQMSKPKGLIVGVNLFALCLFFSVFFSVCLQDKKKECSYHCVPSAIAQSQIDKRDAFHSFLSAHSFVPVPCIQKKLACW